MSCTPVLENGVELLPYRMECLTEDMIAKAERELNETEKTRSPALEEFRRLLRSEVNLTCPDDDAYLLQYLRARKFQVNKAFSLMQNFYSVKKAFPDLFSQPDWQSLRTVLKEKIIIVLPYRDEDGCVHFVCQVEKWNPETVTFGQMLFCAAVLIIFSLEFPPTQINGIKVIIDAKGLNVKHITQITPRLLHLLARALRNVLPCRFKAIHIVNEAFLFQYLWKIFKMIVSDKIKNRFFFHGSKLEELAKTIPKELLLTEYGGEFANPDNSWHIDLIEEKIDIADKFFSSGYKSKETTKSQ